MAKLSGNYGGGSKSSSSSKNNSWTGGRLNGGGSSSRPSSSSSSSRPSTSSGNKGGTGGKLSGGYGGSSSNDKYWSLPSGAQKVTNNKGGSGSYSRPASSGASNGYTVKTNVKGAYTGGNSSGAWTGNTLLKPKTAANSGGYTVNTGVLGATTGTEAKKNGVRLAATGGGPKNGKYLTDSGWEDTNSVKVPRRDAIPGFTGIYTPNSTGRIKGYSGGKLGKDLVIRYPNGVDVDPTRAAKAQAFVDYSYGGSTSGNNSMASLYGQDYTNELQRLANLKVGEFAWGNPSGGEDYSVKTNVAGAYTDRPNYLSDYESALREAQEASAEALRASIEQGVGNIYAQKDPLKDQYAQAAQQAYIAKMQGQKALPQQLAAQGLTGGATESANLALETNYGNGLNDLTNTYNQGVSQIDRDAANYRATGDISIAQNAAQYQQQMANAALQAAQQQEQLRQQMALAEANRQWQAQQDAINRQWQSQQTQAGWDWQSQQSQAEWERNKAMKQWEMQQEYDYWLKKLGAKGGGDVVPPPPKAADLSKMFSKVTDFGEMAGQNVLRMASAYAPQQPVYASHGGRDLGTYPMDYQKQIQYTQIITDPSIDDAEKTRRIQRLGASYNY